jgi:iron complex outermembrane recepter protein
MILGLVLGVLTLAPAAGSDQPAAAPAAPRDLRELSLEELMDVEVVSVTKGEQRRLAAPAAVAVITGEDIRRSGATSLPEALRMAPGLHVARVTSSVWGVSSRGFSSVNSAKLLVLMDGRSLYTPLFSGVFWDVQDTPLADVERIEVIRGPGGTLWGANAMNGVINVTTKSARDARRQPGPQRRGAEGVRARLSRGSRQDVPRSRRLLQSLRPPRHLRLRRSVGGERRTHAGRTSRMVY